MNTMTPTPNLTTDVPSVKTLSSASTTSSAIDENGLSWPSIGTKARKLENSAQRAQRLDTMASSVTEILKGVGEDPSREGLLKTPMRYAKALEFFTKGYEESLAEIVNDAVFEEDHEEMV